MRALITQGSGTLDDLVIKEVDDPVARPAHVVVDVHATSVDFVDTLIATGKYQIKIPAPFTPGNNVAGTVVEVGPEVTRFKVGDRVHGLAMVGGFAERVAVAEAQLRPTPPGLSADVACLAGVPYRTAYDAIASIAGLRTGEDLVVLGASGGVGSAAILIGKALGARVIACASTEDKIDFCRSLGADEVISYSDSDLKTELKRLCPIGADVVLDLIGGQYSEPALRATGYGGRFVVVGFASGDPARVPLNLVLLKGSIIRGYEIADFERMQPEQAAANRDKLESLLARRRIEPPITGRYALERAAEAMRLVASRNKLGSTIVQIA